MRSKGKNIAFFGSSLVSAYWNGAATYYRGIIKTLYAQHHRTTFYEPDAYDRQANRDIDDPNYARVVVYAPDANALAECLREARDADIVIKASGVGVFDRELEERVLQQRQQGQQVFFWDVDAPATLDRMIRDEGDYFRKLVPEYDHVFTYGGGSPVENAYKSFGAQHCTSVFNAFDPETHFPVPPDDRYGCDLAFLGNRLPDRERRVEQFFIETAQHCQRSNLYSEAADGQTNLCHPTYDM
jgi:spore maturation protein CgeB